MKSGDYLRVHIPVEGWTYDQRARGVRLGNRIERKLSTMLAHGADPDRLMAAIEGYFPE